MHRGYPIAAAPRLDFEHVVFISFTHLQPLQRSLYLVSTLQGRTSLISAPQFTEMAPPRWRMLHGSVAAITGGTTGIGRAIAIEYLRQGCNVAINHLGLPRDEKHKDSLFKEAAKLKAEKIEGEIQSKAGDLLEIVGDVTKSETGTILVEKAVEKWGKLDIFVANAGVFQPADFLTYVHFGAP
jgi:hypothetical protein